VPDQVIQGVLDVTLNETALLQRLANACGDLLE